MDEQTRKLEAAKGFLAEHKMHSLMEQMTAELVQHKPNQPVEYLIKRLKELKEGVSQEASRPHVVFVLGGAGAGKGTQCARIVDEYGAVHLSAGDLLRDEARLGTENGHIVSQCAQQGTLVPGAITISLLKKEIAKHSQSKTFLVDGFPRDLTQAMVFEKEVCECTFLLSLEAPDDFLAKRLAEAAEHTSRTDYTPQCIKQRLATYHAKTKPVLEYYAALGKLHAVDATLPADDMWKKIAPLFV